jgi:perosamine synthetase
LGACPRSEPIPLIAPEIRGNEWRYVKECLDTGWVSSAGTFVDRFEHEIAAVAGTRFAVATVNGTSALHIGLIVAGIEPNDEVLVPTLTFVAPVNAIRYVGAWPVFVDAEPDFCQMDPARVEEFLNKGCRYEKGHLYNLVTGRRVTGILPVHILGHPVDLDPILRVARKFGLKVIEDATEGLGAKYKNKNLGKFGDVACFSFNGNKLITTGGGGMIVTDNEEWARKAKYLTTQAKDDPIEYIHREVGYNYRLTNLQAAVGCGQLENLNSYIAAKRQIAERYFEGLRTVPGMRCLKEAQWALSTYWMFTILIEKEEFGLSSRELLRWLDKRKIQTRPLWQPIHLSEAHSGGTNLNLAVAEKLNAQALSLPCSVGLKPADQDEVITQIALANQQA